MHEVQILARGPAGTYFASLVEKFRKKGSRYPFLAAVASEPKAYNAFCIELEAPAVESDQKTRLQTKTKDPSFITAPEGRMHGHLRRLNRLSAQERPQAIIKFAQENPEDYNLARAKGLI